MTWRSRAACTSTDPTVFFDPKRTDTALRICSFCAVQQECLLEALTESEYGVRGGKTEEERRRLFIPREIGPVQVQYETVDSY